MVAPFLNLTNRRLIDTAIELLNPKRTDRVLDIGFGPGYSLVSLARRAGRVVGVDYSRDMVEAARKLAAGQPNIRVRWGDAACLPFRARTFDCAITVNSIYYWPDLAAGLREIVRVLKPGGKVAIGCRSPLNLLPFTFTWSNFKLYDPEEIAEAMRGAGLRVLRIEHRDKWRIPDTVVVLGRRVRLRRVSTLLCDSLGAPS